MGASMLVFVDQAKHIRIVRRSIDDSGQSRRESLGRIPKDTLEVPSNLRSAITAEESAELSAAIDFHKRSIAVGRQAQALALPEHLRVALEYLDTDASDEERRIIVAAIMAAARQLR